MPAKIVAMMEEKKIKGRKRHIAVDIMGNLLGVVVHAANLHDTATGIFPALEAMTLYPTIKGFSADAGYRGTFVEEIADIFGLPVEIPEKDPSKTWEILPKRWVVERTFAWLNSSRRLSKDYEITTSSEEAMINISHIRTLVKRL